MLEIEKLNQQPGKDILIGGRVKLVQALMQADLIDEINLVVHPAIARSGKGFYNAGMGMSKLELVESRMLSHGAVILNYARVKGPWEPCLDHGGLVKLHTTCINTAIRDVV